MLAAYCVACPVVIVGWMLLIRRLYRTSTGRPQRQTLSPGKLSHLHEGYTRLPRRANRPELKGFRRGQLVPARAAAAHVRQLADRDPAARHAKIMTRIGDR